MNLKGIQTHQLLAALGACLAAMLVAGPAAARPFDDGGCLEPVGGGGAVVSQTVPWYLTDQYRSFMLPAVEANRIVNQRQLELAADRSEQAATADEQLQVIPYLSHGILEPEQAWEVIPYLSHGVLTQSDAASLAATSTTPDGYQPQLGELDERAHRRGLACRQARRLPASARRLGLLRRRRRRLRLADDRLRRLDPRSVARRTDHHVHPRQPPRVQERLAMGAR